MWRPDIIRQALTAPTKRRAATRPRRVDPALGERVRALRLGRGMTQAALAGAEFTKGFISLLETGRVRPSIRSAEILAQRLGVSVGELVSVAATNDRALELTILRAEAELSAGRPANALALADATTAASGTARARVERLRGRALYHLGRAREALQPLERALQVFQAARARELAVRTTFDLALAHGRLGNAHESLNLTLECDRALRFGELVDRTLELQVASYLALKYVTAGDFESASQAAERARALAEDVADPRAVADLYHSLAVTRQEQGDFEAALAYARRSLAAWEQVGSEEQVASTWNTIAWVYVQRRQFARAEEALDKAEQLAAARGDGRLAAYVLQTRAELALARGDAASAATLAGESVSHPAASPRCRALSLLVKAEAVAQSNAPLPEVRAAFAAAIEALAPEGRRQVARAYRAYFEALGARGLFQEATAQAQKALELLQPSLS